MPNKIDQNGLQVNSLTEVLSALVTSFNNIYGSNINLDQNTPDAQLLNIFAQMIVGNAELLQDINASFDPDQAVGVILDQRVKLNGITRKQGSYTKVYVEVSFNDSTTIKGLDQYPVDECFQVSDDSGNILVCEQTTSGVNGETHTVSFRALNYGALIFNAGSITKIATPQLGVELVNNVNAQYFTGNNEESDVELRVRRTSNALQRASVGELEELNASLLNIEGVNFVNILENDGDSSDANGIPAKGIWIILDQVEDDEVTKNIGTVIYKKRILGTPMKHEEGSSSSSGDWTSQGHYMIERPNGEPFIAYWTKPTPEYVDVVITAKKLNFESINQIEIEETLRNNFSANPGQYLTTNNLENIILENIEGLVISDIQISRVGEAPVEDYLIPSSPDKRFVLDTITVVQG